MTTDVLNNKLENLRRCLARLRDKTPVSATALAEDLDAQDILCLNLERAVQVCVDIATHLLSDREAPAPDSMADAFVQLTRLGVLSMATAERMSKAVGFRNIAVHEYQALDWQIVYALVTQHLDDFADYAREVAAASPG